MIKKINIECICGWHDSITIDLNLEHHDFWCPECRAKVNLDDAKMDQKKTDKIFEEDTLSIQQEMDDMIIESILWYMQTGDEFGYMHAKSFVEEEMEWQKPMFKLVLPEDYKRKTALNPPSYWPRTFWGTP